MAPQEEQCGLHIAPSLSPEEEEEEGRPLSSSPEWRPAGRDSAGSGRPAAAQETCISHTCYTVLGHRHLINITDN